MGCQLLFHHSDTILNKFRICTIWYIRWRKPCQLSDWMRNPSYYNATVGIQNLQPLAQQEHEYINPTFLSTSV